MNIKNFNEFTLDESFNEDLNEANVEFVAKGSRDAIGVRKYSTYAVISQKNHDDNETHDIVIGLDNIDELCKILQKMK